MCGAGKIGNVCVSTPPFLKRLRKKWNFHQPPPPSYAKQFLRNSFTQPMLSTEFTVAIDAMEFTEATLAMEVDDTSARRPNTEATEAKLIAEPTDPRLKKEKTLNLSNFSRRVSQILQRSFAPPEALSMSIVLIAALLSKELLELPPGAGASMRSRFREAGM